MLLSCLLLLLHLLCVRAICTCSCCLGIGCKESIVGSLPASTTASGCTNAACASNFPRCPSGLQSGSSTASYSGSSGSVPSSGPSGISTSGTPLQVDWFALPGCMGQVVLSKTFSPGCQSLTMAGQTVFANLGCQSGNPSLLLCQDPACSNCVAVALGTSGSCGTSFLGLFGSMKATCVNPWLTPTIIIIICCCSVAGFCLLTFLCTCFIFCRLCAGPKTGTPVLLHINHGVVSGDRSADAAAPDSAQKVSGPPPSAAPFAPSAAPPDFETPFCAQCGGRVQIGDASFCSKCGAPLPDPVK